MLMQRRPSDFIASGRAHQALRRLYLCGWGSTYLFFSFHFGHGPMLSYKNATTPTLRPRHGSWPEEEHQKAECHENTRRQLDLAPLVDWLVD
jgi:hypothetical protein